MFLAVAIALDFFFILWMLVSASSIFVLLSLFCLIKFSQNQVIARAGVCSPRGVFSFVPILAFVCFVLQLCLLFVSHVYLFHNKQRMYMILFSGCLMAGQLAQKWKFQCTFLACVMQVLLFTCVIFERNHAL